MLRLDGSSATSRGLSARMEDDELMADDGVLTGDVKAGLTGVCDTSGETFAASSSCVVVEES